MKALIFVLAVFALAVSADDRIRVELFTESMCPGCASYQIEVLKPALEILDIEKIANISIYPYGNAGQKWNGTAWEFTCQHGVQECYGNVLIACALKYVPESFRVRFAICVEEGFLKYGHFDNGLAECGASFNVSTAPIISCFNGAEGNAIQHKIADYTDALKPKHT